MKKFNLNVEEDIMKLHMISIDKSVFNFIAPVQRRIAVKIKCYCNRSQSTSTVYFNLTAKAELHLAEIENEENLPQLNGWILQNFQRHLMNHEKKARKKRSKCIYCSHSSKNFAEHHSGISHNFYLDIFSAKAVNDDVVIEEFEEHDDIGDINNMQVLIQNGGSYVEI